MFADKFSKMGTSLILILRAVQGIFALVVLILSAAVAHWYNTTTQFSSPSEINFLVFGGTWSLLSIACLGFMPRLMPRVPKHYLAVPFEITNMLFWLSGFVALAVFLSRLLFCRGAVCSAAQANAVFAAFSFAVWTASSVITAREVFAARPAGTGNAAAAAARLQMTEAAA